MSHSAGQENVNYTLCFSRNEVIVLLVGSNTSGTKKISQSQPAEGSNREHATSGQLITKAMHRTITPSDQSKIWCAKLESEIGFL